MVYTDWDSIPSQFDDPLNEMGTRNVRSTPKIAYNCAGYALECFTWYSPRREDSDCEYYMFHTAEEANRITAECVEVMLSDFPNLRVVDSLDDVRRDEYAILFRISSSGDFHYLKRDRIGRWRHKMGADRKIRIMKKADIFKPWPWYFFNEYDGPIVILANKHKGVI